MPCSRINASSHHLAYVDYYAAVVAENQGMKKELAKDGVHPNLAGYQIMEPLAKAAIDQALAKKPGRNTPPPDPRSLNGR